MKPKPKPLATVAAVALAGAAAFTLGRAWNKLRMLQAAYAAARTMRDQGIAITIDSLSDQVQSCSTCRYSEPYVNDEGDGYTLCRAHPPQVYALEDRTMMAYPHVEADDWCHMWQATER